MPSSSSSEVEGIRRTLSEIQRLAGTLAEADRQRASQSPAIMPLAVYRAKEGGAVTKPAGDVASVAPAASLPLVTWIGAACGVLFVAGVVWFLSGTKQTAAERATQAAPPKLVQNDAAASQSGRALAGAAATILIPAAPKPAEAAKIPVDPAELAAVDPALPQSGSAAPAPPVREGTTTDSTSAAWQGTTLKVTSLLAAGRIAEARELLMKADPESDPDAAWALARTFDPRYVARIPGSDAAPDVALATKWYRTWHALALAKGRISGDVVVERILRGMN